VGIDPHPSLLTAWGVGDDIEGLRRFCDIAIEAFADLVAVVKPQSAFFERFGYAGIGILESTIRQLRTGGSLALLDVKRGDIGSTMAAYADAYLDQRRPLSADAITVTPYLGFGSLRPVIDMALSNGAGVFVVTLTSNPEGAVVQQARQGDGRTVAQTIIDEIAQVNAGVAPLGDIGAVIGATLGGDGSEPVADLAKINGPMLAPGLGAQGGRPEDLRRIFGDDLHSVLPSYSREILARGPDVTALRDAVREALDSVRAAM